VDETEIYIYIYISRNKLKNSNAIEKSSQPDLLILLFEFELYY